MPTEEKHTAPRHSRAGGNPAQLITDNINIWSSAIQTKKGVGRGSSKKLNLYGIKKLRELILELAVRGLLVPQDPDDEPALKLLGRVNSYLCDKIEKKQLPKLERDKSVVEPSEFHAKLPASWTWCELQDIFLFLNGKAHEQYISEEPNYILINSKFVSNSGKVKKYASERLTPLHKDDIAMVMSDVPNGRALARCYLVEADDIYTLNQRICGLITSPELDKNYLMIALDRNKYLLNYNDGKKQTNLKKIQVMSCPVAIPQLAEQHRIVAKVDELMALCDQLEQQQENSITAHKTLVKTLLSALTNAADKGEFDQAWEKIANHFDTLFTTEHSIDQLKQTIQQLAIMGKLIPHDINNETAAELLDRLSAEKEELIQSKSIKKSKNIEPVNDNELPFKLPSSWQWTRLDTIGKIFEYGTSTKAHEDPDGVPVLRMGNIQNGEIIYENLKYVDSDIDELPRLYLQHGDLVFNRTNSYALVGKMGVFDGADDSYTLASYLIRVKLFNKYIEPRFINMFFQTPVCRTTQIEPQITVQTNQANFNGTKLKNILIPLAPLEEQKKIVEKVDELMSLCEQVRKRISEVKITQLHLADAMLEQAVN